MSFAKKRILKSGKIRWRACYIDRDGTERHAGYFTTRREAKRVAADAEAKVRRGTWQASGMTFSDYYEGKWVASRGSRSLNTREGYRHAYESSLRDRWGDVPLERITRGDVQSWVDQMVADGVGAPTIHKRYRLLRLVLAARRGTCALSDGIIEVNPCQYVDLPEIGEKPVDVYSPDEFEQLVAELPNEYWKELAIFQAETGLRWGELMGIQLDRFTVGRRRLIVQRTIVQTKTTVSGNGTRFSWKEEPKGRSGRAVAISPTARAIVDKIAARDNLGPADRLFNRHAYDGTVERTQVWPEGVPLCRETWALVWYDAADAAGLRRLRPHTLRGSNLSWLLNGGDIDPNAVREHAGHKSLLTTQKYLGAMPDADDRLLSALERTKSRYTGGNA